MESLTSILKNIIFTQEAPTYYRYDFTPGIFHRKDHLNLQGKGYSSFYILHSRKKKIIGHLFFHVNENTAFSPLKATYGGFEVIQGLDLRILWEFIRYYEDIFRNKSIRNIKITMAPAGYNLSNHTKIFDGLLHHKYTIHRSEISAIIPVTNKRFTAIVSTDVKRRIKILEDLDIKVEHAGINMLEKYYYFIKSARDKKQYSLSMKPEELQRAAEVLGDKFHLFGLYLGQQMIAGSIAMHISDKILYNFYSAHDPGHDKLSPVTRLIGEMYSYCKKNSISMLDLGTSALEEGPNFPLLHFKEHLGAELSSKLTFVKKLM